MRACRQSAVLFLLPLLAAAQSTVLQIHVLEGEGAIHASGARAAKYLTVEVTDELGKPVPGALVSFRLPEDGPGGVFSNGLHTEVVTTAEDGAASAPSVRWNRLPGAFEIRVVAATEQARAGMVVPMYLSAGGDRADGARSGRSPQPVQFQPKRRSKWLLVGLIAAGAAGVGLSTGWARGPRREAPKTPEPPRIGSPVISIGRP